MGEEKFIGDKDTTGSVSAENTTLSSVPEEKDHNTEEHSGERSHHHHHHRSSSHHHSSSSHRSGSGSSHRHSSGSHHGGESQHGGGSEHHSSGSHHSSHHHSSSHGKSGSHHHRHSKRKHRSRVKKWFSSLRKFFKELNNKKRVSFVCAIVLVFIMVFSVGVDLVQYVLYLQAEKAEAEKNGQGDPNNVLRIELLNQDGMLVSDAVNRYSRLDLLLNYENVMLSNYAESGIRYDIQKPVTINISTVGATALAYRVEIADNAELKNAKVEYLDANAKSYTFEHLSVNTEYHYRVTVYTDFGAVSKNGTFHTADTTRFLSVSGLYNVRDIGNWQTDSDGKRIKQGLLIRGSELDGTFNGKYQLTKDGMVDMIEVLGIKFDMDLRSAPATPSSTGALGTLVEHKYYEMDSYESIFTPEGKAAVNAVFSDFAVRENYPIYIHCTDGGELTGTVCYLLEALLGVSRGDCRKDYGLSNLPIEHIIEVEKGLAAYGEHLSLREQVEEYLINSCDITMDQIKTIRNIFLGE